LNRATVKDPGYAGSKTFYGFPGRLQPIPAGTGRKEKKTIDLYDFIENQR